MQIGAQEEGNRPVEEYSKQKKNTPQQKRVSAPVSRFSLIGNVILQFTLPSMKLWTEISPAELYLLGYEQMAYVK
jgi:hypothetical protein